MGGVMQSPELLNRATQHRNAPTPFEKILWKHLNRSQLGGYKFRRQHVIGHRIVDFFCPEKGLVVEVDGDTHDAERDRMSDLQMHRLGFHILRITNREVGANINGVLEAILFQLNQLPDRWAGDSPTPSPPLKGRGL